MRYLSVWAQRMMLNRQRWQSNTFLPLLRRTRMMGIKRTRQFILDILVMMRFAAFGSTIVMILLGAASASPELSLLKMVALISAAFFFHGFVYISNDLIDLDIDRTQKVRIDSPLVQGNFSRSSLLIFGLIELVACFVITLGSQNPGEAIFFLAL